VPYYRCASCGITAYGGAGYANARVCPNCDAVLDEASQLLIAAQVPHEIHRRMLRRPRAAAMARRELRLLMGTLDKAEFEVTALLMTELIANAVKHAGGEASDVFELDVLVSDDVVHVAVSDDGEGFEPAEYSVGNGDPADGHWGLRLVEGLADRWDVVQGDGILVWFELDRRVQPGVQPGEAALTSVPHETRPQL